MAIGLIALGAIWVVLNPAPVVLTKKEPPVKKTLAYQDALAARDQEIDKKTTQETGTVKDVAGEADKPSSVEDILADDQAPTATQQGGAPQDGAQQDLAALPDGANPPEGNLPAEPLPWANQQPGNAAPPQAGYPPNGVPPQAVPPQDPYGSPQYPGANPYGQNAPGAQDTYGQNPPGDPYGAPPPGQTAYPGQDRYGQDPYGQDPYGQNPYGQAPDPAAPYGRDPYSQEPYGPDGRVANAGPNTFPGEPPYPGQGQPPYPGQAQNPYPGQDPYGQPQEEWVRVIGSGTGMRNSASEDSPVLFAFPYGRNLQVVSRNGAWVEVKDPNSSAKGWMEAHALAPTANPNTYAQQRPYYEEPKKERSGPFRNFINRAFGN